LLCRTGISNVSLCFEGIDYLSRLDKTVYYVKVSVCGGGLCWADIMTCCVTDFDIGESG